MTKQKQVKINIPEGYVIDKENSTFEVIKFKKAEKELPISWEELKEMKGYYINSFSKIVKLGKDEESVENINKNTFPTKKLAEAALALAQLLQLKEVYNDGWQPNWIDDSSKYSISVWDNKLSKEHVSSRHNILSFKTPELRDKFFKNFKDLLEIAKPLL